ncbi:MAG: biopolymer transporter ExbD [Verrucomicrobiota bacterium]|nr:biopolymer transporter ExbD [Verrucomicrobiota bacterium]
MANIRRQDDSIEPPVSSLIDVVFLLIIFFIVTANMDEEVLDMTIKLAQAKYVDPVKKKDPRAISINVKASGDINIATQPLSLTDLHHILASTVNQVGNDVPIVVRADALTKFNEIDKIIEIVGKSGLYRIKLSALSTKN